MRKLIVSTLATASLLASVAAASAGYRYNGIYCPTFVATFGTATFGCGSAVDLTAGGWRVQASATGVTFVEPNAVSPL
jgi:hypothetical protein